MAKLSEILGRDVVSRSDGSVVGRIEDVYFDEFCKNIRFFRLVCNGDEYLLPIGSVASFSDAVMVEDGVSLLHPQDADITAIVGSVKGRKVFTASGKSRGEVTDASFAASGRVSAIATDEGNYSPASFSALGEVFLLKGSAKRKPPQRTEFPKAKTDYKVHILDSSSPEKGARDAAPSPALSPSSSQAQAHTSPPPQAHTPARATEAPKGVEVRAESPEPENPVYVRDAENGVSVLFGGEDFTPHRIIADYNFLLGRVVTDDIASYTGEPLAARGERVTTELVEKVRRHGKLMELTLNSR